jgi:ABC-type lipoprotein release transport system permease subunit
VYRQFLSLRYLRARWTNWIGTAGITVAVGALILILSIMSGFLNESRRHLRGNLADILIQPVFEAPLQGGGSMPNDPTRLLEMVRADERVAAASAQLQWYGMLTQAGKGHVLRDPMIGDISMVQLVGIDVEDEYATTDLRASLEQSAQQPKDLNDLFAPPPKYEPSGRPLASVILGEQLASFWHITRGDEIELATVAVDPGTGDVSDPSNKRYVVAGTFRSGENEMDMERIYLDRRELGDLLGKTIPYSTVLVKLKDYEADKATVCDDLTDKLAQAGLLHDPRRFGYPEVRTWEQFRGNLLAAIENERALMGIMLSLVMVVAGFTVFALLSMMVTEKRRDIGVLTALGATPAGIMSLFVLIGLWEALFGALLGMVAGIWLALRIDPIERALSRWFNIQIFNRDVYLFDHIPAKVEPYGVMMIVLGAFACTLVFAAIPAWRAARLHPIDALRYE